MLSSHHILLHVLPLEVHSCHTGSFAHIGSQSTDSSDSPAELNKPFPFPLPFFFFWWLDTPGHKEQV